MSVLLTACASEAALPVQVHGRYVTSDPDYAGQSFTLSAETFVLDLGDDGVETYPITEVRRQDSTGGRVLFDVSYRNAHHQEYLLSFYHLKAQGSVVMKNRPRVVWTRKEGS